MIKNVFIRLPTLSQEFMHRFFLIKNNDELRVVLNEALTDKEIQKALRINHPLLLRGFLEGKTKTYPAIFQYLLRMSYRPTPSGLFSSIGKLKMGEKTSCFTPRQIKKESFLSFNRFYLSSMEGAMPLEDCTYLTNPTLRVVDTEIWLWVPVREADIYRQQQVKYSSSSQVISFINFCRTPRTIDDICKWPGMGHAKRSECLEYLKEMIETGIIQHDFSAPNLGSTPIALGEADLTQSLKNSETMPREAIYKADSKIILDNDVISSDLLLKLHEALSGIRGMSAYWKGSNYAWYENLKMAFKKNYDERTIPLIDFLHFHLYPKTLTPKKETPEEVKSYLDDLLTKALGQSQQSIELTDEDISLLKSMFENTPHIETQIKDYSVIMSLGDESKSPYLAKMGVSAWGLGGLRGKARFMHMFPGEDFSLPESLNSDKIFFDIEFDSRDQFFDLTNRPRSCTHVLRLTHSKKETSMKVIDLHDIDVCLQGNFFKLFSRTERKELIPVLTAPYIQIYHEHPVYRFFGFVAQDGQKINLKLPYETKHLPFVPAISYKKVLMTPRTWRMTKARFLSILENPLTRPEGMPDWVSVGSLDRVFPVCLLSPFVSSELLRKFRPDELITFEDEWHLNHGRSVELMGEHFSQELLVEWTNGIEGVHRPVYSISSHWISPLKNPISVELSLPGPITEIFLGKKLLPFLESLVKRNEITSYYFLRYPSPDHHLRLRLFEDPASTGDVWAKISEKFAGLRKEFLIGNIRRTLFESEKETYGGEKGEKFYHEISCVLSRSYLQRRKLRPPEMERLPFEICYMIHFYLELLNYFELPFELPEGEAPVQIKQIVATFRKDYKALLSGDNLTAVKLAGFIRALVQELPAFEERRIKTDPRFFFKRIIHTEFYRVLGGEHSMIEKALPYLVAKVIKHVY